MTYRQFLPADFAGQRQFLPVLGMGLGGLGVESGVLGLAWVMHGGLYRM